MPASGLSAEYERAPTRRAWLWTSLVLAVCGSACDGGGEPAPGALRQTSFRVRADMEQPLNSDGGWAGGEGETVVVRADEPFRVRFEVEAGGGSASGGVTTVDEPFRLQVRRNAGAWEDLAARDFPYPDEISSPRVSIVRARGYEPGAPAEDLLAGSTLPFQGGVGVSLDSVAAPGPATGTHGEWEWPVVIRRFADGAVTSDEGDDFEFRMRTASGSPVPANSAPAHVRLTVPPGLLGGTFVETPGRLGPWQSIDGALHFVMEPAETYNALMMVKSEDLGARWREVDGTRRPGTGDLEGLATAWHQGRIHILHQISESVVYHVFGTVDSPGGEGWEVRDEFVASPGEPPVQVATLELRADGSAVAVYGGPRHLGVRVRSPGGEWGTEERVEASEGAWISGPQSVLLQDGRVVLAYTEAAGAGWEDGGEEEGSEDPAAGRAEGRIWIRVIDEGGIPGPPLLVSRRVGTREQESGALVPLTYLPETAEVVLLFRQTDGHLWERRLGPGGALSEPVRATDRPVVQNAVDSDQVGADAVVHDGIVHLLFIEEATRAIHHTQRLPSGEWTPDVPVVEGIDGQWVRGSVLTGSGGGAVYGFVYDAGSDGGSGMNRYGEVALESRVP